MNRTNSTKSVLLLAMIVCLLAFACGCKIQISDTSEASDDTGHVESTIQPTQTPNLTPTPASVYIPREELPDGRLFEEGYYSVLPGEGANCNVFDCDGTLVDSFHFNEAERTPPTGLLTEQDLSVYYRSNEKDVQTIVPEKEDEYENNLRSYENGFYQKSNKGTWATLILYNTEGKHIVTLTSPFRADEGWVDIVVKSSGEETIVSFSTNTWNSANDTTTYSTVIYFIASDGTVQDKCEALHLPGKPLELLAKKYFVVFLGDYDTMRNDLVDFEGNIIKEDVTYVEDSLRLYSGEGETSICLSDYYIKDGQVYNASFQLVEKNSTDTNGKLIYGLEYEVQGITCKALYGKKLTDYMSYSVDEEIVAVGMLDDQIAIKTQEKEYVFAGNGLSYYAMNDYILILTDGSGSFQFISLETGEVIHTNDNVQKVEVADLYLIVDHIEYDNDVGSQVQYIIDKNGNVRYYADIAIISCSVGENIILTRGPYIGIADLNGEWIIKTLTWEMTRDEEYVYEYR
jgi:hypothetical protein